MLLVKKMFTGHTYHWLNFFIFYFFNIHQQVLHYREIETKRIKLPQHKHDYAVTLSSENATSECQTQTNLELDNVELARTASNRRSRQSIQETMCTIPSSSSFALLKLEFPSIESSYLVNYNDSSWHQALRKQNEIRGHSF